MASSSARIAARRIKSLSDNRPRRRGQAHFAPRTPQNEPVPDGSRIGAKSAAKRSPPVRDAQSSVDHVAFLLGRAYYNYLGLLERVLAATGLDACIRPGMGHVLFALFERDDRAMKDLVERLDLSYSTVSGMLTRMKRAGVVELTRDAGDGRSIRVRLAPLGRSLEDRCFQAVAEIDRVIDSAISPREAALLRKSLRSIGHAMRRHVRRTRADKSPS